jgi:hypothetical protein
MRYAQTLLLLSALTSLPLGGGCGTVQRYPLAEPVWSDPDRNHVPQRPRKFYSGLYADAVDQVFLRPLTDLAWIRIPGEARNVNAMDEVPDSSWFTNRIGMLPISPARAAVGPCTGKRLDPNDGPWLIKAAKTGRGHARILHRGPRRPTLPAQV